MNDIIVISGVLGFFVGAFVLYPLIQIVRYEAIERYKKIRREKHNKIY